MVLHPQLPVTLQVDASAAGVGAALLQDNQPVAFYSDTLTATERDMQLLRKNVNFTPRFVFH